MISSETYGMLKLLADDIATARRFPAHLERFVKIVIQDGGQDKIVQKFSPDATRAAILVAMVEKAMRGLSPMDALEGAPPETLKTKTKQKPSADDEFTAAALADIKPGKPEPAMLKPPVTVPCVECHMAMENPHPKKKFCSQKCKDRYKAKAKKAAVAS